ncbi:MAG: ABC transporter ATP-binding protein [Candidatus Nomurabacteria bacterium]|nr:MAG: ABC transporter ATP-binding protein [Candidatus Nomurabacteria bacterium]
MAEALVFSDFKKHYGPVKAVDGISFSVQEGELFGFLGPNGAGKTTTIRTMMDFLRPTEGSIHILGKHSVKDSVALKERIGYLSGSVRLYDRWTGEEHFSFVRRMDGDHDIAKDLCERLQFDPKRKAKQLSSGNRQKLAIIMAFMRKPDLFILDEPTNALDPLLQHEVYELLREASARGATIFMSSHNLAEVERVCDRVGIIRKGKMVAVERIDALKAKQLYKVELQFSEKPDKSAVLGDGVTLHSESSHGYVVDISGDIRPFLARMQQLPLRDIVISHATLEEIFMKYYEA